jgi:hypothetical protein
MGGVNLRGRVAWIGAVVLTVVLVTVLLLVITAQKGDDFWRIAVPTYLTGVGTLALAVLNVMLLTQEAADRKALADAQTQRDRDDALREARKVITTAEAVTEHPDHSVAGVLGAPPLPSPDVAVRVLNAGTEPIVDVRLISGASRKGTPPHQVWTWELGNGFGASYAAVLLPSSHYHFAGRWVSRWGWPEDQNLTQVEMMRAPSNADRGWLEATIAWTDSRGLHWRRTGPNLPEQLAEPWTWDADLQPAPGMPNAPPP